MTDINTMMDAMTDVDERSNEKTILKSKLLSIVSSLDVMDEERENIKEIVADLKAQHGIEPKVAKAVAKILRNPEVLQDMEDAAIAIENLYKRIS